MIIASIAAATSKIPLADSRPRWPLLAPGIDQKPRGLAPIFPLGSLRSVTASGSPVWSIGAAEYPSDGLKEKISIVILSAFEKSRLQGQQNLIQITLHRICRMGTEVKDNPRAHFHSRARGLLFLFDAG